MGQARAVEVALVIDEYLGLVHEPAKRGRVNNPVAIALVFTAVAGRRFRMAPAPTLRLAGRVRSKLGH